LNAKRHATEIFLRHMRGHHIPTNMSEKTPLHEKRPMHIKIDLNASKENYVTNGKRAKQILKIQKNKFCVTGDVSIHQPISQKRPAKTRRDLHESKETCRHQKRPV